MEEPRHGLFATLVRAAPDEVYRSLAGKVALLAVSVGAALFATETILRRTQPYEAHRAAQEMEHFRLGGGGVAGNFTVDEDMGFRPILGKGRRYSEWGTLGNQYAIEKREDVERLLFVGDSVTRRGRIVSGLRDLYGETGFEYWNAGVESFNTAQELEFYRRYNTVIDPDHVVLTFHINDFQTTPVAFLDSSGNLVVYATHRPVRTINRDLFERFHLYRLWVGATTIESRAWREIRDEVRRTLLDFKETLQPEISFTVLVLPILSPPEQWSETENASRREILQILEDLQIRHFDLTGVAVPALDAGVVIRQEPDDPWHPSHEFAELAAIQLQDAGLFEGSSVAAP